MRLHSPVVLLGLTLACGCGRFGVAPGQNAPDGAGDSDADAAADADGDATADDADASADGDRDGDGDGDAALDADAEDDSDSDADVPGDAEPPCTPVGHDEDGDGVDDGCDNCPTQTNTEQPNADGDELGDACDWLLPADALTMVLFLDAFQTTSDPPWSFVRCTQALSGDALDLSPSTFTHPPETCHAFAPLRHRSDFVAELTVHGVVADCGAYPLDPLYQTPQVGIVIAPNGSGSTFWCAVDVCLENLSMLFGTTHLAQDMTISETMTILVSGRSTLGSLGELNAVELGCRIDTDFGTFTNGASVEGPPDSPSWLWDTGIMVQNVTSAVEYFVIYE